MKKPLSNVNIIRIFSQKLSITLIVPFKTQSLIFFSHFQNVLTTCNFLFNKPTRIIFEIHTLKKDKK